LRAAVLVEDAEWRHLALAGTGLRAVPPSARSLLAALDRDPDERVITVPLPGDVPPAVATALTAGETNLGWLTAFPQHVMGDVDRAAMHLAANALAIELTRDQGGGKNRRRTFWERLVNRTFDDPIEARDEAAASGITLAPQYLAVAIEAEGLEESTATAKTGDLRRIALETIRANGEIVVLERGGGFVFLCPAQLEVDAANLRTAAMLVPRAATKAQFGAKVVGGVGRVADAIDAARTLEEARSAMFIARRIFGGSRVMPYDDLGIYPLLVRGNATSEELRAFSDRVLAPLRAYDEKHQTELIRTLRLYFEVGQNVKTAAAELSVHRHTVFYRLRQIAEISRFNLDSPHDQLTLRTAIAIDALTTRT